MTNHPPNDVPDRREKSQSLIFVVDDEVLIGQVVESILEGDGYKARFFANPQEAYACLSITKPHPDLLVTDYVMSPWNGMELIQKCRQLVPELPAILYSGNVSSDITDLYAVKPNAFLEKPFLPRTLLDLVHSVLHDRG